MRPATKVGIIIGGFIVAYGLAWLAVDVWQRSTPDPADRAAAPGMYGFGDLVLGVAVFGVLSLAPLSLGLYWLRSVRWVWLISAWSAVVYAGTGPLALAVSSWCRNSVGFLLLFSDARIGLMPLSALVLLAGGLFAPQPRWRWMLIGSAVLDGAIFSGVVLERVALSHFRS